VIASTHENEECTTLPACRACQRSDDQALLSQMKVVERHVWGSVVETAVVSSGPSADTLRYMR
jgi:hypothetical protein